MFSIPQSTAFTVVFKAYQSSDHVTEATGKTIAVTISKAGGAFGNPNAGATNATEIANGWYKVALDSTDTGTVGLLAIRGAASGIDDIGDRFLVEARPANFASLAIDGSGRVDLGKWGGTAVSLTSGLPDVNVKTITDGIIAAATFAANALDAVWSTTTRLLTAGTNIVLAKGTGLTGLNDLDEAGVRTSVGLASANLDTQLGDLPTSTDLTTALAGADDATLAAIAALPDAVWDEAIADHSAAGSAGQAIQAAGAAGDPLLSAVPGSYASGTAGAALGRIGSGQITTVSPVAQSGDVSVIRGDDYLVADSRALEWTDADASWPDLTSATISVDIEGGPTFTGAVVGGNVQLELTDEQTSTLKIGPRAFSVRATIADGSRITLLSGTWRSSDR